MNKERWTKDEGRRKIDEGVHRLSEAVVSRPSVLKDEGWRKRRYKAVFINKLTDAAQEAAEAQTWLEFALKCSYINEKIYKNLNDKYEHIFAMLITMERKADAFCK